MLLGAMHPRCIRYDCSRSTKQAVLAQKRIHGVNSVHGIPELAQSPYQSLSRRIAMQRHTFIPPMPKLVHSIPGCRKKESSGAFVHRRAHRHADLRSNWSYIGHACHSIGLSVTDGGRCVRRLANERVATVGYVGGSMLGPRKERGAVRERSIGRQGLLHRDVRCVRSSTRVNRWRWCWIEKERAEFMMDTVKDAVAALRSGERSFGGAPVCMRRQSSNHRL